MTHSDAIQKLKAHIDALVRDSQATNQYIDADPNVTETERRIGKSYNLGRLTALQQVFKAINAVVTEI